MNIVRPDVQVLLLGEQANRQHTVSLDQDQLAKETDLLARMSCVCIQPTTVIIWGYPPTHTHILTTYPITIPPPHDSLVPWY